MRTLIAIAAFRRTRGLMFALLMLCLPVLSKGQAFVSVFIAPPALPVYVQPAIPGPGYIWTPGYWANRPSGYYWVPGTWVLPAFAGALWTPGYWGWRNGGYLWNAGYWGPHVGFYGGVNYGFGYTGVGYVGGYWNHGAFYYNRAANNVNVASVHNTYNTVINNTTISRISYNGGPRGIQAEPTAMERDAINERHEAATDVQIRHENAAAGNHALLASENHGRPPIAATPQPGVFDHPGVVAARGNRMHNQTDAAGGAKLAQEHGNHAQGNPQFAHQQGVHNHASAHPPKDHPRREGPHKRGEPGGEAPHP